MMNYDGGDDDDEIQNWLSVAVHFDLVRLELTRDLVYQ